PGARHDAVPGLPRRAARARLSRFGIRRAGVPARRTAGRGVGRRGVRRHAPAAGRGRPAARPAAVTAQARPLRLGLLSTAAINRVVLDAAAASDRVDVVAVASRTDERARAYAEKHAIGRWYGAYDDLLADP